MYKGPLHNPNDMKPGPVKDAYISYREQRTRCYNKKREKYKHYGAKGIQVKYSSREFIHWWLKNIKKFKGKDPTVSRIDHSGHYEFGNIKIESRSENSIERNNRVAPFLKPTMVDVLDFDYKLIKTCKSINAAAREFNLDSGSVWAQVKLGSKRKSNTKIRFRKHPWI